MKTANENLSVQPKVVTPEAASNSEATELADNLANIDENQLADKDVDLDAVKNASENMKSADDIDIDEADNDLNKQAEKLETIFDEVGKNLAKAENSGGGKGVVIVSVLPEMKPRATGFFPLKVNLRNITLGRKLKFWPSVDYFNANATSTKTANTIFLADSVAKEGDAFFLDSEGNPVTKITGNAANMSVVPYLEAEKDYSTAFITADATESDLETLETLAAEINDDDDEENTNVGGSGGGCNLVRSEGLGMRSFLMFLTFSLALALLKRKFRQ